MNTVEPARDSLVKDREGDVWEYLNGGWHPHPLYLETAGKTWAELHEEAGPLTEFKATGVI